MNSRPTTPCEHIVEWLMLATKDLCESAKHRVSAEIEAHYKEAVEAHVAEGIAEYEARKIALEELGDAKAAGKRFQNEHLTENEVNKIRSALVSALKPVPMVQVILLLLLLGLLFYLVAKYHSLINDGRLIVFFVYFLWVHVIRWAANSFARYLPRQAATGWLIGVETISGYVPFAILIYVCNPSPSMMRTAIWIFVSLGFISLIRSYRLWKKFQRERAHGNDPIAT